MSDLLKMANEQMNKNKKPVKEEIIEEEIVEMEVISKEEMIDVKKKKETTPKPKKKETFELSTVEPMTTNAGQIITKEDVKRHLDMYNYVKQNIVDKSDFASIKGKKFLKKSGVRKFINAFGISIELIDEKVYNLEIAGKMDTHAEVRVRAITQKGQSVEGIGIKSLSELFDKNLHNLKATAWTRAVNRAILDLVAFGEVSAEEIAGSPNDDEMF